MYKPLGKRFLLLFGIGAKPENPIALALLIFAINLAGDGLHQLLTPEERA